MKVSMVRETSMQASLQVSDIEYHNFLKILTLLSCFSVLESTKTSSKVEKSLNKSFQTLYTFLGGSEYQTSNNVGYPRNKHSSTLRACSHEPGTVNYPWVMIAPGQALPRVHTMICCPGATLPRVKFIAPTQVHRHLITTNISEFL